MAGMATLSEHKCTSVSVVLHHLAYNNAHNIQDVLDGAMVLLALYTYNICHPGFLLRPLPSKEAQALEMRNAGSSDTMLRA